MENTTPIDDIQSFYSDWYGDRIAEFAQSYPKDERVLEIDFGDVRQSLPDIADDYLADPETVREWFEEALRLYELPADLNLSGARVRFTDLADALSHEVRDVGDWTPTGIANSFTILRGQVSKRTQGQILVGTAYFECQRCGTLNEVPQAESPTLSGGSDGLQDPHECVGCERQGPFILDEEQTISSGQNFQTIRLQRPPEANGDTRETLDVNLRADLVDSVRPGDRVAVGTEVSGRIADGGDHPTMELYGDADAVERLESDFTDIDPSEYIDEIEEIANSADPYQEIIDSILPSHRGDEELKEAIAYQLFGGVEKTLPDGNQVRGTIHVFAVGDPGVGKSTLLRYVEELAPRSVYTTGTGSTEAGLTCAAMKDDFGDGGWTLEAGALVEANNGVCCVDELDDMAEEDRAGLLEAMSDQRISVSKAGINAELPAQTRVLAAANPELGRFDQYESIADQIDIHPALLSRFDLVFTLTDEPDAEEDQQTAAHINRGNRAGQRRAAGQSVDAGEDIEPPISPELMRAYVSHARQFKPVLTDAADERIRHEYVQIRQANDESEAIPTTPRMVGALTRLAEAAARIRLGEYVTVDDVERAIRIYRESMEDVGMDPETGEFDADVVETGTSDSQRSRVNAIKKAVAAIQDEHDNGAPKEAIVDMPSLDRWDEDKIEHEIEQLKEKGELYEPRNGYLRKS